MFVLGQNTIEDEADTEVPGTDDTEDLLDEGDETLSSIDKQRKGNYI